MGLMLTALWGKVAIEGCRKMDAEPMSEYWLWRRSAEAHAICGEIVLKEWSAPTGGNAMNMIDDLQALAGQPYGQRYQARKTDAEPMRETELRYRAMEGQLEHGDTIAAAAKVTILERQTTAAYGPDGEFNELIIL